MARRLSRRRIVSAAGIGLAAVAASACSAGSAPPKTPDAQPPAPTSPTVAAAQAAKPATLRISFFISVTEAGHVLALQRGYYKESGIDLQILEGKGSNLTMQLVSQQNDTFGKGTIQNLIQAVQKGAPLKVIAGLFQKSPSALIARGNSGIKRAEDLAGHSVAGVPGGSPETLFPALLAAAKVNPASVQFIPSDQNGKLALLLQEKVDAIFGYVTTEPLLVEAVNPVVISYADYGLNVLDQSYCANSDWLKQNGDITRRFVTATMNGWRDATKNPGDAIEALLKQSTQVKRDALEKGIQPTLSLLHSKNTEGKPLGWMAAGDWEQTQKLLHEYGMIEQIMPIDTYYTNEFVPPER